VVFFQNLGWRLLGLAALSLAAALILALSSFSPSDPTWNRLSDSNVLNMLGNVGANLADLLLQAIGWISFLIALPIMNWGIKCLRLKWIPRFWLNFLALPPALILLAIAATPMEPHSGYPLQAGYGGALGQTLFAKLLAVDVQSMVGSALPNWLWASIAGICGLLLFAFSLAFNKSEWAIAGRVIARTAKTAALWLWAALLWAVRSTGGATKALFASRQADPLEFRSEPVFEPDAADDGDTTGTSQSSDALIAEVRPPKRVKKTRMTRRGKREQLEAQPMLDLGGNDGFKLPPLGLLATQTKQSELDKMTEEALEQNARMLEGVLDDFGVKGQIIGVHPGPVVTLYELEPDRGVKAARVIGLADDIARSMSAISARVAVIPGRNAIGIELPNVTRETVFIRELLAARDFEGAKGRLPLVLGKDISGAPVVADLAGMPHLLVAGTTGSGKSVGINTMIISLLYRFGPEQLRLIMVDPKMLELSIYDDIPHLLTPVVTEPKKAVVALKWAVREMEERYRKMSKLGVRNLAAFNKRVEEAKAKGETLARQVQTGFDKETGEPLIEEQVFDYETLPYIVIIIDEMADLMLVAGKEVEATVQRLAQMARAAGLHLIMATQRPSVDVITGTIKANFPTRMSFQVTSKIDSRTILGEQGAEQLLGMGDMLFMAGGGRITRVHGAFISDTEVEDITNHLRRQGAPDYLQDVTEEPAEGYDSPFIPDGESNSSSSGDSLYDKAVAIVVKDRRASTSYVQRRLSVGYNKAATLIERMEEEGVISAPNHKGQREVLVPDREEEF